MYTLAIVNFIFMLHIGLYTIGANSYDILRMKKEYEQRKKKARINNSKPRKQKLVSVIIPAHNEEKVIRRTLDSVLSNNYLNIEILVVNDGSTDKTASIVKGYIKRIKRNKFLQVWSYFTRDNHYRPFRVRRISVRRKNCRIKLITQKNQGKAAALNNAINNHAKGQLIMTLDADSILHPQAIEKSVAYFKDNRIIGVAANVRIIESTGYLNKLQRFEHLIGYRSKKMFSLTNCEFVIGGVASTYRKSTLKKVHCYDEDTVTEDIGLSMKIISKFGNKDKRIVYGADVVALTEGVGSFSDLLKQRYRWKLGNLQNIYKYRNLIASQDNIYSKMLTHYRLPMAILSEILLLIEPFLLLYILYLSLQYRSLGIIIGAYLTITIYVLSVLWPDEHLRKFEKIKLSSTALWIYCAFYLMDIVQYYSIFKTIVNHQLVFKPNKSLKTWISPKRNMRTA